MGEKKYKDRENVMNIWEREANIGGGWERDSGHKKGSVFYWLVWKYFDYP